MGCLTLIFDYFPRCLLCLSLIHTLFFFQAAKDTKHRVGAAADQITIVHFNDVYNIESREQEPVGGAAR